MVLATETRNEIKNSVVAIFDSLELEDLQDIQIILRKVMSIKGQQQGLHIKIGSQVHWQQNHNKVMTGIVTKVNKTSVNVDTTQGPWRVHLSAINSGVLNSIAKPDWRKQQNNDSFGIRNNDTLEDWNKVINRGSI